MPLDFDSPPLRFRATGASHTVNLGEWRAFRESLTPEQLDWLKAKQVWEHASAMAIAIAWGVPGSTPAPEAPAI